MERVDFLVIGAGIAGLSAAIRLADAGRVLVVTKEELAESNTAYAQGGIAVAVGGWGPRGGAHSWSRILHANGDATGREMAVSLLRHAREIPQIELMEWTTS